MGEECKGKMLVQPLEEIWDINLGKHVFKRFRDASNNTLFGLAHHKQRNHFKDIEFQNLERSHFLISLGPN